MKTYSVLIVDDERDIRENFMTLLGQVANFKKVVHAKDGVDALFKLENQQFDLIITDNIMPKLTGLKLIKEIRGLRNVKNAKILLVSANLDMETVKESIQYGCTSIISKPVKLKDLKDKVSVLLGLSVEKKEKSKQNAETTKEKIDS